MVSCFPSGEISQDSASCGMYRSLASYANKYSIAGADTLPYIPEIYSVGAPSVPMAATGPVRTILRVPPRRGCPARGVVVVGVLVIVGLAVVGATEVVGGGAPGAVDAAA